MKNLSIVLIMMLWISFLIAGVQSVNGKILFSYEDANASEIYIAGSFNDWNTTASKLTKDENGIWMIELDLDEGSYQYKFIVDGNWNFDQTNPEFEDDGYGGSNSVVKITSDGKIKKSAAASSPTGIKASFNPKIYFTGRYYSNNYFRKDNTDRFLLEKPEHDINLGFRIKFNNDFEGFTLMNINNVAEGTEMWKSHLNYKRSYLKMKTDVFNLTAFDNLPFIRFDDPLHIVGSDGKYNYDFGKEYRGFIAEKDDLLNITVYNENSIKLSTQLMYSDYAGGNADIGAGRIKLYSKDFFDHSILIGSSIYKYTDNDGTVLKTHNSNEIDFAWSYGIQQSEWQDDMRFTLFGEYYNFENIDETESENTWLKGNKILMGSKLKFPAALNLYAQYLSSEIDFKFADVGVTRNTINLGSNFKVENGGWNLDFEYRTTDLPDSLLDWKDYYKYVEATSGNGRWDDQYSDVNIIDYTLLGYETGFIWSSKLYYQLSIFSRKLTAKLNNSFAHHDLGTPPKFIDNNLVISYDFASKWKFLTDTRLPYYNDDFLEINTNFADEQDVFISNYSEISYSFSPKTRISIGYGVCPWILDDITDEFSSNGRDEFLNDSEDLEGYLENYYGGFGEKLRSAEEKLMDEQRITIQGVIEF